MVQSFHGRVLSVRNSAGQFTTRALTLFDRPSHGVERLADRNDVEMSLCSFSLNPISIFEAVNRMVDRSIGLWVWKICGTN